MPDLFSIGASSTYLHEDYCVCAIETAVSIYLMNKKGVITVHSCKIEAFPLGFLWVLVLRRTNGIHNSNAKGYTRSVLHLFIFLLLKRSVERISCPLRAPLKEPLFTIREGLIQMKCYLIFNINELSWKAMLSSI